MRLNTIKPGAGSKRTRLRVGRGASAGQGKTCGRGVKGQRARKGGYHKVGFEGGQMPLQRRLPKIGFRSAMKASRAELTLSDLMRVAGAEVTLAGLIEANLVPESTKIVKIILSGKVTKPFTIKDKVITATKGAKSAVESAGGQFRRLREIRGHIQHQCCRRSGGHHPLRRNAQAAVVPAGRARGVSDRHLHSGPGHRCGQICGVLFRLRTARCSACSTCFPAARCSASASSR